MEALLKITTIPIEYQMKISPAKLERSQSSPPVLEMSRQRGGMSMRSQPARLFLDTYDARNSVVPTTRTAIYQNAQKGIQAAGQAAQAYAGEAAQMIWSKPGQGGQMLDQIFAQRTQLPTGEFQLGFIPTTDVNITYQEGDLQTNYQMDRLAFNLKLNNGTVEYIPGSIEIEITQYPDVQIEYMGKPVYVPPSAAERFTGETVDVVA